jgi:hypothetical protein
VGRGLFLELSMLRPCLSATCLAIAICSVALPATAQSARPLPPNPLPLREQARMAILDVCVESEAPKVGADVDVTAACECYAKGMAAALSEGEVSALVDSSRLPPARRSDAASIYAQCSAGSAPAAAGAADTGQ